MGQPDAEQICEARMTTLLEEDSAEVNQIRIQTVVEDAYQSIYARARKEQKVLLAVNQTITSQLSSFPGHTMQILYMITLVGTVVDAELMKQQQRLQQFDPRVGRNN